MNTAVHNATPPALRPEGRLLLTALRTLWDPGAVEMLGELLRRRLDWDYVIAKAMRHGIEPVLRKAVRAHHSGLVPDSVGSQLQRCRCLVVGQNLRLWHELAGVLRAFEQESVRAMPLKGPLLARDLYGDMGLRAAEDLDLLVPSADLQKAAAVLLRSGYRAVDGDASPPRTRSTDRDCERHFVHSRLGVSLEIHWGIVPRQAFDSAVLWQRAQLRTVDGMKLWGLPPEELFVVLCVHAGGKHRWTLLKWLCDIALLTSCSAIDWPRVMAFAGEIQAEPLVLEGVCLMERLLHVPVAEPILQQVRRDPRSLAILGLVLGRLFRNDEGLPGFHEWRSYLDEWSYGREGAAPGRVEATWWRYARSVAEPEFLDAQTLALPRFLSALQYLWRPVRILRRRGAGIVRRVFDSRSTNAGGL